MPLTSDPAGRRSFASDAVVRFPMFDGDVLVPCGVTPAALLTLATDEGLELLRIEASFERFRLEIEHIASDKYDRGHSVSEEVVVDVGDL